MTAQRHAAVPLLRVSPPSTLCLPERAAVLHVFACESPGLASAYTLGARALTTLSLVPARRLGVLRALQKHTKQAWYP